MSWRDEVLAQLDAAQEEYALIAPGNAHFPSAGLRMDGFTSDVDWLLAFQLVAFNKTQATNVRHVQLFGHDVPEALRYTSTVLEVTPETVPDEYSGMLPELAVLRKVVERDPDAYLLSPDQLLDHAGKVGLTHLFRLTDWRHVDEGEDELPSQAPCFQAVADAIAARAAGDFRSCTEDSNTHWSHWLRWE